MLIHHDDFHILSINLIYKLYIYTLVKSLDYFNYSNLKLFLSSISYLSNNYLYLSFYSYKNNGNDY